MQPHRLFGGVGHRLGEDENPVARYGDGDSVMGDANSVRPPDCPFFDQMLPANFVATADLVDTNVVRSTLERQTQRLLNVKDVIASYLLRLEDHPYTVPMKEHLSEFLSEIDSTLKYFDELVVPQTSEGLNELEILIDFGATELEAKFRDAKQSVAPFLKRTKPDDPLDNDPGTDDDLDEIRIFGHKRRGVNKKSKTFPKQRSVSRFSLDVIEVEDSP